MNNLTTCPNCLTRFIVGRAQLKANQGQVKCSKCQHVFDYRQHLESSHEQTVFLRNKPLKSARQLRRLNFLLALLVLVTMAQILIFGFEGILNHWPAGRSTLIEICDKLPCKISLPQNISLVSLDDAELIKDENHLELMKFSALLSNGAQYKQAFPQIELTLTDKNDRILMRKRVQARDYLNDSQKTLQEGLKAGEELHISIHFQTSEPITGFKAKAIY